MFSGWIRKRTLGMQQDYIRYYKISCRYDRIVAILRGIKK